MPRRRALTAVQLDELFALPTEKNTLVRYWTLDHTDLEPINQRRRNPSATGALRKVCRCRRTHWAELRRDMARLRFVMDQIREIEAARLTRLEQHPELASHAMVRLLARVIGIGIETADMLVHEILSRNLRDRKAVARYAGLTGSPDESGARRREKGLARAGNAAAPDFWTAG
jgi:transposase